MSIRKAVDHAIDLGSKHISLSPRQYRTLFRSRHGTADVPIHWHYRKVRVSVWGYRRMM